MNRQGDIGKYFAFVLGCVQFVTDCSVRAESDFREKALLLRSAIVVDVESGTLSEPSEILIGDGRIVRISKDRIPVDPSVVVVDLLGHYVIPGLVDAHVHMSVDPAMFAAGLVRHGVTLARDMGGPLDLVFNIRKAIRQERIIGPELTIAGPMLDGSDPIWPFSISCVGELDAREAVRILDSEGIDHLKVYERLGLKELNAIVDEASGRGLPVVGHIPDGISIDEAISAGLASIEHLDRISPILSHQDSARTPVRDSYRNVRRSGNLLQQLRERNVVICPTAHLSEIGENLTELRQKDWSGIVSPQIARLWKLADVTMSSGFVPSKAAQETVHALWRGGIPLVCGTDLGVPFVDPGASLHREMLILQSAGLSPEEVLRASTVNAAKLCGRYPIYGTVTEGAVASLVLLGSNPLKDVRNIGDIRGVVLRGKYLGADRLGRLVSDVNREQAVVLAKPVDSRDPRFGHDQIVHRYETRLDDEMAVFETCTITRRDSGYLVSVRSVPQIHILPNWETTYDLTLEHHVRSIAWRTQSLVPRSVQYRFDKNGFSKIESTDPELGFKHSDSQAGGLIIGPEQWAIGMLVRGAKLKVGDAKKIPFWTIGYPLLDAQPATISLVRSDDRPIRSPEGMSIVQAYKVVLVTAQGTVRGSVFLREDGAIVGLRLETPLGVLVSKLVN